MSTVLKRHPAVSCRGLRCCTLPKATSVLSSRNQIPKANPVVHNTQRQRTGSYVNFSATTVDFYRVLARLEAANSMVPDRRPELKSAAPVLPAAQRKAWSSILESVFGGVRSKQQQIEARDIASELDDGSPLSHAVVMFTATWCGPCSAVYRELKLASGRLQGRPPTAILMVDVEDEKELASEVGIKALPTLLYLSPDGSRGPIFTQGPVSASCILDAMDRAVAFGGRDIKAKWLKL